MQDAQMNDFSIFQSKYKAFVYFLYCKGCFKIGYTTRSVKSRVRAMFTGNPFIIDIALVIGCTSETSAKITEKQLHQNYEPKKIKGEWFGLNFNNLRSVAHTHKGMIVENNIEKLDTKKEVLYIEMTAGQQKSPTYSFDDQNKIFNIPFFGPIISVKDREGKELNEAEIDFFKVKFSEYHKTLRKYF